MQKTPNGLAVPERAHQIKRGRKKKKKNENAASTKIVVLVVMQYLKENNSKVVLAVVPGANGRRKWRWSFSHSDKRSHNEGTDCVIMAGAAPSPCSGDEQHKRHI